MIPPAASRTHPRRQYTEQHPLSGYLTVRRDLTVALAKRRVQHADWLPFSPERQQPQVVPSVRTDILEQERLSVRGILARRLWRARLEEQRFLSDTAGRLLIQAPLAGPPRGKGDPAAVGRPHRRRVVLRGVERKPLRGASLEVQQPDVAAGFVV